MPYTLNVCISVLLVGIHYNARYKDSITKSTRGWKERWFSRSNTISGLGTEVRREVNAGIAAVSRMMERLETKDDTGPSAVPAASACSPSDANNQRTVSPNHAAVVNETSSTTCASGSGSQWAHSMFVEELDTLWRQVYALLVHEKALKFLRFWGGKMSQETFSLSSFSNRCQIHLDQVQRETPFVRSHLRSSDASWSLVGLCASGSSLKHLHPDRGT